MGKDANSHEKMTNDELLKVAKDVANSYIIKYNLKKGKTLSPEESNQISIEISKSFIDSVMAMAPEKMKVENGGKDKMRETF
mgnify:FL=1